MAMTNAEKQAAWRARRDEELRKLRVRVWELERKLRNLTEKAERKKFHLDPAKRKHTAVHEAGHAVIGLARQLPIALAVSVPSGRAQTGYVSSAHETTYRVGRAYRLIGGQYKATMTPKAAQLDAFGNPPRKIEQTPEEHRAEILVCFAGPMAEAKLRNQEDWRSLASGSDMRIAQHHRGELGEAARPWEEYEREAAALVDKFWPMIEAVAARLMKVEYLRGSEVDDICGRVARQQRFNKLRNRRRTVSGNTKPPGRERQGLQ
jgi:hypothetical protein